MSISGLQRLTGKTLRYFTLVLEGFDLYVFPVTIELLSSIDDVVII
jgi:hypothetical protein